MLAESPSDSLDNEAEQALLRNPSGRSVRSDLNRVYGLLGTRVPWLNYSAGEIAAFGAIVAVNLACVFGLNSANNQGIPTNFGYLNMGNAALVIVLATRNSFLQLLVSPLSHARIIRPNRFQLVCNAAAVNFLPNASQARFPFDRSLVLHRWLGYVLFGSVSLHMLTFWSQVRVAVARRGCIAADCRCNNNAQHCGDCAPCVLTHPVDHGADNVHRSHVVHRQVPAWVHCLVCARFCRGDVAPDGAPAAV